MRSALTFVGIGHKILQICSLHNFPHLSLYRDRSYSIVDKKMEVHPLLSQNLLRPLKFLIGRLRQKRPVQILIENPSHKVVRGGIYQIDIKPRYGIHNIYQALRLK